MLLVKDFKIELMGDSGKYQARAWNAHSQFICESESPHYVVRKAVLACLEYHVARYFEASYVTNISTGEIVYRNLPFIEFETKLADSNWTGHNNNALVNYEGQPAHLDLESELCHGFRITRVAAVRFLSTVRQAS